MHKYTVNEKAVKSSKGNNQGAAIEDNCEGRDKQGDVIWFICFKDCSSACVGHRLSCGA